MGPPYSILQFVDADQLEGYEPLVLEGCDLVPELDGYTYERLALKYRLRLKRATVKMTVIKRQSNPKLRYHMFQRLNTGGTNLSAQEIRNATARMVGQPGITFYSFLVQLASHEGFLTCIDPLAESDKQQGGSEELVLRFLALKNARDLFKQNVRDWLNSYMEKILLEDFPLNYDDERREFDKLYSYLSTCLGEGAFVRYNKSREPIGGLAPAYYEAVTMGVYEAYYKVQTIAMDKVRDSIIDVIQSAAFKEVTGPAANTRKKLDGRISLIREAILAL
jgi:hypothetical protein